MKIVVSGGMGYIGRVLVPMLVGDGHYVVVVDNFRYRQVNDLMESESCQVIEGDVRYITIRGYDVYIPLAGLVGAPMCAKNEKEASDVNIGHIRDFLYNRGDTKIIYPTTNSGYGSGICTEDSPMNPVSLYGQQKVSAEKMILDAGNSVTLRLATVFGVSPCMRGDLLVNWLVLQACKMERAAMSGMEIKAVDLYESHFTRNYVHVKDVASVICAVVKDFDRFSGNCYNFGLSDANLSKRELCQEIQKVVPSFRFKEISGVADPDQRNYIVRNDKIEAMGFRATRGLEEGIGELVEYYRGRI